MKCTTSDKTRQFSDSTMGSTTDTITWLIYSDQSCSSYTVASESRMGTNADTSTCVPDGTNASARYFYSTSSLTTTKYGYNSSDCSGTYAETSMKKDDYGKCIQYQGGGLQGYAYIGGVTYGVSGTAHLKASLSLVLAIVAACFAF
ncbi:unnamed protein product [Aphanomyces euteiches]